jgi:hypothetical protein
MDQYTVIIADIKGSRKMRAYERYEWQLFLKSAIVQINEDCADAIEAQFMITKGDEFQGVLKNLSDVHRIMIKFERLIFPLILRYGVGFGVIQKMGSKIPIEMDGKAFHRANAALNKAKKKKYAVYINTDNPGFDLTVNAIYQLIYAIKGRWSETNFNRYWKYKEMGTYEKVAHQEGVSTQAVWDSLHNSNAIDVINAENALDDILCEQNVTNSFSIPDKHSSR